MKRIFIISACIFVAPVTFIYLLVFSILIYRNNYLIRLADFNKYHNVAYAALPTSQNIFTADIQQDDGRVEHVRQFLKKYGSPLEPHAKYIVDTADAYDLDWRLLPAIAMQESNLCRRIPVDSHNCWGFGIYGGKVTRFSNYEEAIHTVTKTLANKYKAKGLVTPEQIVRMWTPSDTGKWTFSVRQFMTELL